LLVYLMCHHVQHHQFRGLLWLADVLAVITMGRLDWPLFENLVRRLGVVRPVRYYLDALDKLFRGRLMETDDLNDVRHRLVVYSPIFWALSFIFPPGLIFSKKVFLGRLRAQLFRNAFK
jgi:hypothetical protein